MKRLMYIALLLSGFLLLCLPIWAQTKYLKIGDKFPTHVFTDLLNYPSKSASTDDFKGKWLILDFWGYSCSGCLASFPKMNQLNEKFKDKIQLIMVGATKNGFGKTKEIEIITKKLYQRLAKEHNLKFTVAFDSVLFLKHDLGELPHILIIDPSGKVKAKAKSVGSKQIEDLLNIGNAEFERGYSRSEPRDWDSYNKDLPLLTRGVEANGGNDTSFLFRSMLGKRSSKMPSTNYVRFTQPGINEVKVGKIEIFGNNLCQLYHTAFYGDPSWEISDPLYYGKISKIIIVPDQDSAFFFSTQKYYYSLIVPRDRSNTGFLQKIMQSDLENYFGYKVSKERKMLPVYFLQVVNTSLVSKLKSKGGPSSKRGYDVPYAGFSFKNQSLQQIGIILSSFTPNSVPIIDKTGFNSNIDLEFEAYMNNFDEVKTKLKTIGFQLTVGISEMEVLVLKKDTILH